MTFQPAVFLDRDGALTVAKNSLREPAMVECFHAALRDDFTQTAEWMVAHTRALG